MARYVNAVYYPSWKVYKGHVPSQLEVDSITHVFYAFARVDNDGTIRARLMYLFLDAKADTQLQVDGEEGGLRALAKLKILRPFIKIIISIGGASGSASFPIFAAAPDGRDRFARTTREFLEKFSLDGVDIDWEHPKTPTEGENFVQLLRATRSALPAPRYQLFTALPIGEYCLKNINLLATARELDFLNLMAYDFTGSWTQLSGHQAQLFQPYEHAHLAHPSLARSCHAGIEYVVSGGFPAEKIVLGIPAYARFFPGATGPGQAFHTGGEIDFEAIPENWTRDAVVDNEAVAASYVDKEKGFMSFDVPATVQRKANFVKQLGLAGLFYWTGSGDVKGPNGLVASGFRALNELS